MVAEFVFTNGWRRQFDEYDTIRYDTIDDLHWKTNRQAASLI